MGDEQSQLWERQESEPNLWYERFMLYFMLGPSRSLRQAILQETKGDKERQISVPQSWWDAYKTWNWKERAEAYDEYRRKQVFTEGNAYDVRRVERLNYYSLRLEQELDKIFASLPKKPKKPWFNHFLYEKYLQTLEALAQETGGRVKTTKQEVTGKDGGAVEFEIELVGNSPDSDDDEA